MSVALNHSGSVTPYNLVIIGSDDDSYVLLIGAANAENLEMLSAEY